MLITVEAELSQPSVIHFLTKNAEKIHCYSHRLSIIIFLRFHIEILMWTAHPDGLKTPIPSFHVTVPLPPSNVVHSPRGADITSDSLSLCSAPFVCAKISETHLVDTYSRTDDPRADSPIPMSRRLDLIISEDKYLGTKQLPPLQSHDITPSEGNLMIERKRRNSPAPLDFLWESDIVDSDLTDRLWPRTPSPTTHIWSAKNNGQLPRSLDQWRLHWNRRSFCPCTCPLKECCQMSRDIHEVDLSEFPWADIDRDQEEWLTIAVGWKAVSLISFPPSRTNGLFQRWCQLKGGGQYNERIDTINENARSKTCIVQVFAPLYYTPRIINGAWTH